MRSVLPALPIFRTETQARLLAALYLRPDHSWTLAALARELGIGASTLHPEVRRLEEAGLLTATTIGRSRVLSIDQSHPVARPLTEILNYLYGPHVIIAEEFTSIPKTELLLIFGSWAARHHGQTGPPPHDIDVLVVGDADRAEVYAAADRAQERVGMPINPVLASTRRWEEASDALIRQIKASPTIDLTPPRADREKHDQ
ncbi:winged helix-turn-helix domain-containing protein [Nonomuraea sp. NEAU-A123]|uniref:winged helix-turn-helix domain-containing protein n=1 Tax=Nonomuraea sp. NEAU-A123 TaxID=2839649 RepID=UPI001BE3DC32|nr:winged helix-turn-helix domain-containing protein [Nonomuraea sp. NEAU-A123]MBT2231770.1 winged helix-turn-helix domain-containing protein [Nonomuraea sp. NEAU-A123]